MSYKAIEMDVCMINVVRGSIPRVKVLADGHTVLVEIQPLVV